MRKHETENEDWNPDWNRLSESNLNPRTLAQQLLIRPLIPRSSGAILRDHMDRIVYFNTQLDKIKTDPIDSQVQFLTTTLDWTATIFARLDLGLQRRWAYVQSKGWIQVLVAYPWARETDEASVWFQKLLHAWCHHIDLSTDRWGFQSHVWIRLMKILRTSSHPERRALACVHYELRQVLQSIFPYLEAFSFHLIPGQTLPLYHYCQLVLVTLKSSSTGDWTRPRCAVVEKMFQLLDRHLFQFENPPFPSHVVLKVLDLVKVLMDHYGSVECTGRSERTRMWLWVTHASLSPLQQVLSRSCASPSFLIGSSPELLEGRKYIQIILQGVLVNPEWISVAGALFHQQPDIRAWMDKYPARYLIQQGLSMFQDQEDELIQLLIDLLTLARTTEQRYPMLDPHVLFSEFLALSGDEDCMLDYLSSSETECLAYVLQYLRFCAQDIEHMVRSMSSLHRLEHIRKSFIRLSLRLQRLHDKALFPYNPQPLIRRLDQIEDLISGAQEFLD